MTNMLWLIFIHLGGCRLHTSEDLQNIVVYLTKKKKSSFCLVGSGTESDSDDSVPELEEQDSAQTQTQQAQVKVHSYPLFLKS